MAGFDFVGKMIKAHRYSYLLHNGKIENEKIICHKCDNKRCVNPEHLYAGIHQDNARDREQRTNAKKRKTLNVG